MGFGDIFKIKAFKADIEQLKKDNQALRDTNETMHQQLSELGAFDYYKIKTMTEVLEKEYSAKHIQLQHEYDIKEREASAKLNEEIGALERLVASRQEKSEKLQNSIGELYIQKDKLDKNIKTQTNKLNRSKELVKAINYSLECYLNYEPSQNAIKLPPNDLSDLEGISPSVILKLHCMDIKDLRKAFKENDKQINSVLEKYSARYNTKTNQAIYRLMVIALRAELQNILYNLKYDKLDNSIEDIKKVTSKYLKIAGDGNQNIAGTLTKFIGEIEYLFINAAKIEYNYYVKKEQARQEQLAIREQMRQEAEERKALETEKKRVEKEEAKYTAEIEKLHENLQSLPDTSVDEIEQLKMRILQLQGQLSDVILKKDEIVNLQNGKAGNVYIISNLGSFGNDVFKIGMTRRLDPQDRVNELGSASVPFKFDVHSFIFSEDAVGLESKLHSILNKKRLNKVNLRKEFFKVTIDELEELVTQIEPSAEFNRTMIAEEFRQSMSSDTIYTSEHIFEDDY